jgi:hypothetical protein
LLCVPRVLVAPSACVAKFSPRQWTLASGGRPSWSCCCCCCCDEKADAADDAAEVDAVGRDGKLASRRPASSRHHPASPGGLSLPNTRVPISVPTRSNTPLPTMTARESDDRPDGRAGVGMLLLGIAGRQAGRQAGKQLTDRVARGAFVCLLASLLACFFASLPPPPTNKRLACYWYEYGCQPALYRLR